MADATTSAILAAAGDLAVGLQAVAEAVRSSCADPAHAIVLLAQMVDYRPASLNGADAIGAAMDATQAATAAACRRAALTSLARASASYQPSSYQDAARVRTLVAGLIQGEMDTTVNFTTYSALRAVRAAVIRDLTVRGGDLARVTTQRTTAPMPALTLAFRLYGDASRYDDLVARNDPVSPLFMPLTIEALGA